MSPLQAARLVETARRWLGTPYHPHGRVRGAGADCITFLACVFEEAGFVQGAATGFYPPDWHLHRDEERYLRGLAQYADHVDAPAPADLAVFRFGRCFSHGALVTSWPFLIHSYNPGGVIVGCADEAPLRDRPVKFFRVRT